MPRHRLCPATCESQPLSNLILLELRSIKEEKRINHNFENLLFNEHSKLQTLVKDFAAFLFLNYFLESSEVFDEFLAEMRQ